MCIAGVNRGRRVLLGNYLPAQSVGKLAAIRLVLPAKEVARKDPERHGNAHYWPYFLPDGRHFLYWARNADDYRRAAFPPRQSTMILGSPAVRS